MKKGLYISNGINVNLENVSVWIVDKETIQLQIKDKDAEALIVIDIYLDSSNIFNNNAIKVPVNEFKRIEREISEYMSIK